jgi:uncharacterized membrane protein YfcA
MAIGSWAGGGLGGRLASRINPERLRTGVVLLGLVVLLVPLLSGVRNVGRVCDDFD